MYIEELDTYTYSDNNNIYNAYSKESHTTYSIYTLDTHSTHIEITV